MSTIISQFNEALMDRESSEMPMVTPMANRAPSVEAKKRLNGGTELLLNLALILGLAIAEVVVVVSFLNRVSSVGDGKAELPVNVWLESRHGF